MVSTTGFGFFSDFALVHQWSRQLWDGVYTGQHLYPFLALFAPISLLPVDVAAAIFLALMLGSVVFTLKRDSLRWILFVPLLQSHLPGPAGSAILAGVPCRAPCRVGAAYPQTTAACFLCCPGCLPVGATSWSSLAATVALHVPFLILRPRGRWNGCGCFRSMDKTGITRDPRTPPRSGSIIFSAWVIPFAACLLILLVFMRRKNLEGVLFLANPLMVPVRLLAADGRHLQDGHPTLLACPGWRRGSCRRTGRMA